MAKSNLPSNYGDEAKKFRELYEKGSLRTTSGSGTYTSITSLITYTYTSGEQDLFTQLSTTLANYNIGQSDWDGVFVGSNIRGSITLTSPNLNVTPLKSGFYYCTSATNKPTGFGNGYLMHVQASTSDVYSTQVYFDEITGRVANRVNTNGTYKAWKENITETFGDVGGTNLDSFITGAEVYGSNFTNAPLSDTGYWYVKINGYQNSGYARQVATGLSSNVSGRMFERMKFAGTWGSWREIKAIEMGTSTLKTYLGVSSGEWHTPSGNADYPYYAYCTVVGATVTTSDKVNVSGASINDFALGASCGIADYTETGAGANTVTIWAQALPTSNINILCEVVKG